MSKPVFWGENKKDSSNLSSSRLAERVVKVKYICHSVITENKQTTTKKRFRLSLFGTCISSKLIFLAFQEF